MKHLCKNCSAPLSGDEIAIYRKLVLRGATEYLCLDCLSGKLRVPRSWLEEKIAFFHRTGICSLFAKLENEER